MANMTEKTASSTPGSSVISIGPYSESMHLVVAKLRYNFVLVQTCLYEHVARVDWSTNTVDFIHKKNHIEYPQRVKGTQKVSINAITKNLRS